jgi:S-adenosylmethionine hydrolase
VPPSRVTLLTDFGTRDGYVAAMRGVIAQISPEAVVEDASHEVPPGDVLFAAWTLARYWNLYPTGTVHVVVVDPGVGSSRRGVIVQADERYLIAPDNGVLTRALSDAQQQRAFEISNASLLRQPISTTFHGRDVFAPVAAHLANGTAVSAFGPSIDSLVTIEMPEPRRAGGVIHGVVVMSDHFGNLVTNIPGDWISRNACVEVGGVAVGALRSTYADAAPGETLALIGSLELLEISVRDGSAEETLRIGRGSAIRVIT